MIFDNTRYISKLLKMIKATLLIAILALLILSFAFAQKWYNENIELQCENMELKMDLLILKEKIRSREDDEEIFIEDLENTQRNRQEILDVIEKYKQQKSERSENELKVMKKKWEEFANKTEKEIEEQMTEDKNWLENRIKKWLKEKQREENSN